MELKKKELGIYIHIPFCKQKCYYCDFTSFAGLESVHERYINCLKKELKNKLKELKNNYEITTIYIGGGTPSYIKSEYIKELLELTDTNNMEVTIEVNPGTVTKEKLQEYKNAGINRLSIGLQTTNDDLLKEIGRIHSFNQFLETFNNSRKVGFQNINVDLMLGLPKQRIEDLKKSINEIVELSPEHISVYSLILEEGTKLYDKVSCGDLSLPDEELERQMYWYVKTTLELNEYKQYEISNFSKEGFESKHNVNCWKQKEYVGVGLGASSYLDNKRYSNIKDINSYISNIEAGQFDKNIILEEVQTNTDIQKEYMMLGLRMIEGVSVTEFKNKFGKNPLYEYRNELDKLVNNKLVVVDGDIIKLSNKGLDLANEVWMEFV